MTMVRNILNVHMW